MSLHLPLFESTYHLINKETIQKMKDNVILINCSRGELIDTEDIIEAIESKKIGANGIIGLKFNTSIIENGRLEIRAYGMAIKK